MAVHFQIPPDLEQTLRRQVPDLDAAAKQALLIDLYRARKISHYQLSVTLGLDRFESEALLKRCGVVEDLPSAEDLEEDRRAVEKVLGPSRR